MKSWPKALCCAVVFVGCALAGTSRCAAADLPIVPSKDVTSQDIPLKFVLEKKEWRLTENRMLIWGKVRNSGTVKYGWVHVYFTAYDADGSLLFREAVYTEPFTIKPGQVGYVDFELKSAKRPARIEYKIMGDPARD